MFAGAHAITRFYALVWTFVLTEQSIIQSLNEQFANEQFAKYLGVYF